MKNTPECVFAIQKWCTEDICQKGAFDIGPPPHIHLLGVHWGGGFSIPLQVGHTNDKIQSLEMCAMQVFYSKEPGSATNPCLFLGASAACPGLLTWNVWDSPY